MQASGGTPGRGATGNHPATGYSPGGIGLVVLAGLT